MLHEHAQHEHVLAAARVGHQRAAFALERNLDHAIACFLRATSRSRRMTRRSADPCARATSLSSRIVAPGLSSPARTRPSSTCSLNATTRSVWSPPLVTALGADADPDAAGAGDAARRRLDLGRDDLDRPDAVAAARGDRGQRLAAALRAFARVADHLDDVLGEDLHALGAGWTGFDGAFDDCGVAHAWP